MTIPPARDQISIIHLLRGLAALMVAFFHFTGWGNWENGFYKKTDWIAQMGSHGNMGVYIFFVISGFVIPYSLIKNEYRLQHFFRFMVKRSIRIEIPYLASIALVLGVLYIFHIVFKMGFEIGFKRFLYHLFYLIPFTHYDWYSIIFWTLGVEFQFYVTIAFFILLFVHKNKILQTLALLGFVGLNFFELMRPDFSFLYSHTGVFAIGIVTCLFYLKKVNRTQTFVVVLAGFLITWYFKGLEIPLFALLTAGAIYFINFETKLGIFFGNISYSLYLIHTIIGNNLIFMAIRIWKLPVSNHLILLWAMVSAILFAWLFWWLVEKPSKRLAGKIRIR